MKKRNVASLAAAATLAVGGLTVANAGMDKTLSIYDTAKTAGFTTLTAAVDAAGLTDVLTNEGPFTVFAPTDAAFAKLPAGTVEGLLKDPEALKNILLYHVVSGKVTSGDVVKLSSADMVNGQSVHVGTKDGAVRINDALVSKADLWAKNGVIHVIDTVLLPPAVANETAMVSSIFDTAKSAGFTTLVTAIEATGLTETLETGGPFTVFAPTDAAFAKLPKGTLASLLEDPEALKGILLYHVVSGEVTSADVAKLETAKTLNGESVRINTKNGVSINDAKVAKTDIKASNGIIHVIDTVLLPAGNAS